MPVKQILPFVVFPIIIISLFWSNFSLDLWSIVMIGVGLLFWNMFEYVFHRFAFHNRQLPRKVKKYLSNGHRFHHRYPNNSQDLLLPLALTLPFSLLSLGLIYLVFGGEHLGWYYSGLIFGLFSYEMMHYAAHHWQIDLAPFKYMKWYHLNHHHKNPNSKFMVSNTLFDLIFRTK